MNFFMNYIKHFDTMAILLDASKKVTSVKTEKDLTILYNEKSIIGFNIIGLKLDMSGYLGNNEKVLSLVNQKIKQYLILKPSKQFVVAEIIACEDIPETHLHKCQVNVGTENLQIVCGAENVRVGLKTVCATVGAFMPSGKQIVEGKLRGIASFGMLCSARELNISDQNQKINQKGIIELNKTYKNGSDFYGENK